MNICYMSSALNKIEVDFSNICNAKFKTRPIDRAAYYYYYSFLGLISHRKVQKHRKKNNSISVLLHQLQFKSQPLQHHMEYLHFVSDFEHSQYRPSKPHTPSDLLDCTLTYSISISPSPSRALHKQVQPLIVNQSEIQQAEDLTPSIEFDYLAKPSLRMRKRVTHKLKTYANNKPFSFQKEAAIEIDPKKFIMEALQTKAEFFSKTDNPLSHPGETEKPGSKSKTSCSQSHRIRNSKIARKYELRTPETDNNKQNISIQQNVVFRDIMGQKSQAVSQNPSQQKPSTSAVRRPQRQYSCHDGRLNTKRYSWMERPSRLVTGIYKNAFIFSNQNNHTEDSSDAKKSSQRISRVATQVKPRSYNKAMSSSTKCSKSSKSILIVPSLIRPLNRNFSKSRSHRSEVHVHRPVKNSQMLAAEVLSAVGNKMISRSIGKNMRM